MQYKREFRTKQLFKFVKKQLRQGLSKKQIYEELLNAGWKGEDIEEAFNIVNAPVVNDIRLMDILIQIKNYIRLNIVYAIVILGVLILVLAGYLFRDYLPMVDVIPSSFEGKICGTSNIAKPKYYREAGNFYREVGSSVENAETRKSQISKSEYIQIYRDDQNNTCDN